MKARQTELPGVMLVELTAFSDERGYFMETWHHERYRAAGIEPAFVQSNAAHSSRGVLRGLHYQLGRPQAKLVWAPRGEILDVAVDIRRGSPTFGRWVGEVLSQDNKRQLFVPAGFAHGYCVLSETADVMYQCSDFYAPAEERGVRWDDPTLAIDWRERAPVVSTKDRVLPLLEDAELPVYTP